MKLTELARLKVERSGEKSWWDSLTKAEQNEVLAELRKWGDQPLSPFARAVIEKFKLDRKVPIVREKLRALQNGKKTS